MAGRRVIEKLDFKKVFLIAALLFAVCGLSATSVYAAPGCPAGCDCPRDPEGNFSTEGIMGQMEAFGDAERVKDKAQAQQIIKQPDNSPGLTCFDRQLALTAKLGNIFSDRFPANMPPPSKIFREPDPSQIPWEYKKGGMDQMLAKGLKNVLTGTDANPGLLQRHAQNFTSSLSFDLGATNDLGFMNTLATNLFDPATGALDSIFSDTNSYMNDINGALDQLTNLVSSVSQGQLATTITGIAGAVGLAGVVSAINSVNQVLNQIQTFRTQFNQAYYSAQNTAYGFVNGIAASANSLLGNYAGSVLGGLFGAFGLNSDSMLGQGGAEACDRMAKLWGDKEWPGGQALSKAITGIGGDKGVPYFKLEDMLGGLQAGGSVANNVNIVDALCPAGAGGCDDLLTVIGGQENAAVLDTLRGLLADNGPLTGPQSGNPNATWIKAETVLSRKNVTLQQIVTAIQDGP